MGLQKKIVDYLDSNEQYCDDLFYTLVKANESVYAGCPTRTRVHKFCPISKEDTGCSIRIYASTKEMFSMLMKKNVNTKPLLKFVIFQNMKLIYPETSRFISIF